MKKIFLGILALMSVIIVMSMVSATPITNIVNGANSLVAMQGSNGYFGDVNTVGVSALGLLSAYQATGNQSYLTAAEKAGNYLITIPISIGIESSNPNEKFYSQDIEFLAQLGKVADNSTYTNEANNIMTNYLTQPNRYVNSADMTAQQLHDFYTVTYDPTDQYGEEWQLASWVRAARLTENIAFANNLINIMNNDIGNYFKISNTTLPVYVIELSALVSATGNSNVIQALIANQSSDGSWIDTNGPVQDTAYSTMALMNIGDTSYAINGASWIVSKQSPNGSWTEIGANPNGNPVEEITGEALQAIVSAEGITFISPISGQDVKGNLNVQWTNPNPLPGLYLQSSNFSVTSCNPNNVGWTLGISVNDMTNYSLDTNSLGGDGEYCLRLQIGNTNYAVTGPFTIDNTLPVISSLSVTNNGTEVIPPQTNIAFSYSDNIGVTSCNITWGDGTLSNCLGFTTASHQYNRDGSYTVNLIVSDGAGNIVSKTVTASPAVVPPTPNIINGPYSGNEGSSISFVGSATDVVNTDTLSYYWNFGDGNTSILQDPANIYLKNGTYKVSLTVTDSRDGGQASVNTTATIIHVNPDAAFTNNAPQYEGQSVSFTDASTHYDAINWSWNFGDGSTNSSQQNPTHVYAKNGTYNVELIVTDSDGVSNTVNNSVTIKDITPIANFGLGSVSPVEGQSVSFTDASTHYDAINWSWNFGDGSTNSSQQNPTHVYATYGTYLVTLAVVDSDGVVSTTSKSITVGDVAPMFVNLPNSTSAVVSNLFNFKVNATDVGNTPVTYSLSSAPNGMAIDSSNGLISWTPGLNQDGDYNVTVVASDDGGINNNQSNLSIHVYDYQLTLNSGLNLVSFPLVSSNTSYSAVLSPIKNNLSSIWAYQYDPVSGEDQWYFQGYNNGNNVDGSSQFTDITPGLGYFVVMNSGSSLQGNGNKMYNSGNYSIPPTQTVVPGWNLIGQYGMLSEPTANALTTLSGYYSTMLDEIGNPQTMLYPTKGYWLFVNGSNLQYAPSNTDYTY